jgi:arylformamidase
MEFIDISIPLEEGKTTYPSVPPLSVKWLRRLEDGDNVSLSMISMVVHLGTHVDAPAHVLQGGSLIHGLELENMLGESKVIDVSGQLVITRDLLKSQLRELPVGKIILLKTGYKNYVETGGEFEINYSYMEEGAADFLVENGVKTVGVDTPNVDRYGDKSMRVHKKLLGSGVIVIENLRLHHVTPGNYRFIGLPIYIKGVEGVPLRAILLC